MTGAVPMALSFCASEYGQNREKNLHAQEPRIGHSCRPTVSAAGHRPSPSDEVGRHHRSSIGSEPSTQISCLYCENAQRALQRRAGLINGAVAEL
jgi:hypothetical protein